MQTKANGISINYRIDGSAGPWLILSNSLATDLSMWDAQARELSGAFRVLRYDQRGHGGSDAPPDPARYQMDEHARDVVAVLDSLGVDRAAVWGASMGGRAGFHLMARSPGRLAALIAGGAHACAVETGLAEAQREGKVLREQGTAPFADAMQPLPGWMREVMLRADGHALALQLLADAGEMSPLSDLGLVTTPVLLLAGERDRRLHLIRVTGDRLSRAEVAVLAGCGHFDTFARTDLTVPLVREFLGRPRP